MKKQIPKEQVQKMTRVVPPDKFMTTPRATSYDDISPMVGHGAVLGRFKSEKHKNLIASRKQPGAQFVVPCVPTILARGIYGPGKEAEGVEWYQERVTSVKDLPTRGVATAMAGKIMDSVHAFGWPTEIAGLENGGLISGLPQVPVSTGTGEETYQVPTLWSLDNATLKVLDDLGIIAVTDHKQTKDACVMTTYTAPTIAIAGYPAVTGEAKLSYVLPNILVLCTFGRYLNVKLQALQHGKRTPQDAQLELQEWMNGYVTENPSASDHEKAERPLSFAKVTVNDDPDEPGHLIAFIDMCPHYRVNSVMCRLQLKSNVGPSKN